jgi:hypothetical protein|tara:strand:+ start:854 stop:1105 length:252 start_codon:yes stop_codon:yes gene_type:complete
METKYYTAKEFLSYLATFQETMMQPNRIYFALIYTALQAKAETNIILKRSDFHWLCSDLELESSELTFIDIEEGKVTIQKSII